MSIHVLSWGWKPRFCLQKWTNAHCWWTMEMVLRFGLSRVIAMAQLHAGDQLQPNKKLELGT
jgi:hypothetical protein